MDGFDKFYRDFLAHRYDGERYVKYFSAEDFPGLMVERISFCSGGTRLAGFFYSYGNRSDDLVVFCHGLGGGHRSYLAEVDRLCREGFTVFTYDLTGCFESEGEAMPGVLRFVADLDSAVGYLLSEGVFKRYRRVFAVGHSFGGYAVAAIPLYRDCFDRIVAISAPITLENIACAFIPGDDPKSSERRRLMCEYERRVCPAYADADVASALRRGNTELLFVHSKNDPTIPYNDSLGALISSFPDLHCSIWEHKYHNPNYTEDAVAYMRRIFGGYPAAKESGIGEEEYFGVVDWRRMTAQDEDFWSDVFEFFGA